MPLFGESLLDLTVVHRQHQPEFVEAIRDARAGVCSLRVETLMEERRIDGAAHETVRDKIMHIVPRVKDVDRHNAACLGRLCASPRLPDFLAVHSVVADTDHQTAPLPCAIAGVSMHSRQAALPDSLALPAVRHALGARLMLVANRRRDLGLCRGSIGQIASYTAGGVAVVRFGNKPLPHGMLCGSMGLLDAGDTWGAVK